MKKNTSRKVFAATASAALIASAVAPAAIFAAETETKVFPDVPADHNYAGVINDLHKAEVIVGQPGGNFNLGASITRAELSLMVANILKLEEGAASTPFEDVKENVWYTDAINALYKAGDIKGKPDGTFDPNGEMTRAEFVSLIVAAYDIPAKKADLPFTDLKENVWYSNAIETLYAHDLIKGQNLTTFGPNDNIKRGDAAWLLANVDYAFGDTLPKPVVAVVIDEAKAVDTKTLEVTFNTAVDTEKAKVELLRGTFKQNATVKWSEDKKTVTLEVPGQLQTADYTVKVSGLGEKALTDTVKVEAQKVESIEIMDDLAVISGNKATVTFVVKDQYGEDITKNNNFKVTTGITGQKINGNTVEIDVEGAVKENSKVAVVLIHQNSGVTATKTVTISKAAAVTDLAIKGIFDVKGKEVSLNEDTKGTHYVVLDLKDQYGKKIVDKDTVEKMLVTNTNTSILTLAANPTVLKIGEQNEAVVAITNVAKAGTTKAIVISSSNGKTTQHDIVVAETTRTDAVSITSPELAIKGEDVLLPLSVADKEGNAVTDIKILKDADIKGLKVTGGVVEVKDGKTYIKADISGVAADAYHTVFVQSSTNKTDTVTFKVEKEAVPTIVTGVKSPLVVKGTKELKAADLIVKDQYGRDVKADKVGDFTVKAVNADSKVLSVTDKEIKGKVNGKDKVRIELANKGDSAIEVEVQVTDGKEYTSYEVKDLGLLDSTKTNEVTVNGVLANGGKIKLSNVDNEDYTVTTNVAGVTIVAGEIIVDPAKVYGKKDDVVNHGEKEVTATFTINADGKKVEKNFTVSNKKPVTQDFFFTSSEKVSGAVVISDLDHTGNFSIADTKVVTTDQYGAKTHVTGDNLKTVATSVTIVPADASKVIIVNNGTDKAEVTATADTTATVTVKIGNATKDLKLNLKKK